MEDFLHKAAASYLSIPVEGKILLFTLLTGLMIQLFYYVVFYSRIIFIRDTQRQNSKEGVSVVICARNEGENLKKFLPSILKQDYPDYEVIVVNDCSEDETEIILAELKQEDPHLYFTSIKEDRRFAHGKKLAVSIGIKAAKNEWVLLTDADCEATSTKWIATMQKHFIEKNQIVLGYGGYIPRKGILNKLIRFDTMFIALQYFTYAHAGIPYMGVGRNLAYRRSLFFKNKGFARFNRLISGDDDLFVNQLGNKTNVAFEINQDGHTRSEPKSTISEWIRQKKRHFTTAKHYKRHHKILLGFEPFSRMLFYFSIILGLSFTPLYQLFLGVFLFRFVVQMVVLSFTKKHLKEEKLLVYCLLFDFILPFFHLYITISNFYTKKK